MPYRKQRRWGRQKQQKPTPHHLPELRAARHRQPLSQAPSQLTEACVANDGASVKKINVWVTSLERGGGGC